MNKTIDIIGIQKLLPHRYPFLLVDKVEIIDPEKVAIGYKNVTANEPFFQGHFPGNPIMPGVLILEAMAQTAGVLLFNKIGASDDKLILFAGMDKVKFRSPVVPGDVLRMEVDIVRFRGKIGKVESKAYVGDTLVAEAVQTSVIINREV